MNGKEQFVMIHMGNNVLNQEILNEIKKMPVIDTHEHLTRNEDEWCDQKHDVLGEYLMHYMSSDIISAGLSLENFAKVKDPTGNVVDRWRIVEPYWEACRYTGYGRALDISVRDIYGINGIRADTIEALNIAFLENRKPGHYKRVLKDMCNIETSLLDDWRVGEHGDSPYFKFIWQPSVFINPGGQWAGQILASMDQFHGIKVKTLDDWQDALEKELDRILSINGVKILKTAIAYSRSLRFEKTRYQEAKTMFADTLRQWERQRLANKEDGFDGFACELEDYMMHYLLSLAERRGLIIQFHTGLLEGNGATLSNSDPSLLNNLFLEYPGVDFDLFHIGYPYQNVICALAKMFPNVFIDMCWAHMISPSACVSALDDFLDAVPYNKISAFGGDYCFVDGVYGHLQISRQNVAYTLTDKVTRGVFDERKALEIARALYYDNPKRIFRL